MTDWEPTWKTEKSFLPVADEAKDEFHERVFEYLKRTFDWGHSSQTREPTTDVPVPSTELIPNGPDGPRGSRLRVANATGGLVVWVVGSSECSIDEESDVWSAAIEDAIARLGQRTVQAWRAVLCAAPGAFVDSVRLDGVRVLSDDITLTPMEGLVGAEHLVNVSGVMASEYVCVPIQVDGRTACWAWHRDGLLAATRRVRRLCALLSMVWDCPWFLRDGPSEHVGASWEGSPGPLSGLHYRWIADADQWLAPRRVPLPDWFGTIEARYSVGKPADREAALLAHHEGMLIADAHPSLAMLAFTSSVEALMDRPTQRCSSCNQLTGSTGRFKAALAQVLPTELAARATAIYDRRSRTVHDGVLHGREATAGEIDWSHYSEPAGLHFEMGEVTTMRRASRAMLWRAYDLDGAPPDPYLEGLGG